MKPYRSLFPFFFVIALAAVVQTSAFAGPQKRQAPAKLDAALQAALENEAGMQRVIVRATPGLHGELDRVLRSHGGLLRASHPSIDGASADVPTAEVAALAAEPIVLSVSKDVMVTAAGSPAKAGAAARWTPVSCAQHSA